MLAEYGSTFKDEHGGIYAWLSNTIGEKLAFIGTFIWLSSWIIWLINISSKVFIPFSALLFGKDMTQTWAFGPFSATQVVGILAILWIIFVTFFASRGADVISKVSSIGGTFVTGMIFVFLIATFISLFVTHGHFEQPITASAFVKSPNPAFTNPVATLSFVVYAIFAYAGMESLSGMIDNIEEPEKTFPKGLLISSILIAVAYSFMILLWGVSVNWKDVLSSDFVNLGNITYIMMQHLGIYLGHSLGLSASVSNLIGNIFIRFVGLGMFLAYVGSFFILINEFTVTFMAFFAIMNPIANLPVFISLTSGQNLKTVKNIAFHALTIAVIIVSIFALGGKTILNIFGINLAALRIVGGFLVGLIGYHMLQGNTSSLQHNVSSKEPKIDNNINIAVSPLAMPILAGPGTIATTMNLAVSINPLIIIISFITLSIITYFLFTYSELVVAKLGQNLMNVITRMMGLILATIGVHMAILGLQSAFPIFK